MHSHALGLLALGVALAGMGLPVRAEPAVPGAGTEGPRGHVVVLLRTLPPEPRRSAEDAIAAQLVTLDLAVRFARVGGEADAGSGAPAASAALATPAPLATFVLEAPAEGLWRLHLELDNGDYRLVRRLDPDRAGLQATLESVALVIRSFALALRDGLPPPSGPLDTVGAPAPARTGDTPGTPDDGDPSGSGTDPSVRPKAVGAVRATQTPLRAVTGDVGEASEAGDAEGAVVDGAVSAAPPSAIGRALPALEAVSLTLMYRGASLGALAPWQHGAAAAVGWRWRGGFGLGVAYGFLAPAAIADPAVQLSLTRQQLSPFVGIRRSVAGALAAEVRASLHGELLSRSTEGAAAGLAAQPTRHQLRAGAGASVLLSLEVLEIAALLAGVELLWVQPRVRVAVQQAQAGQARVAFETTPLSVALSLGMAVQLR